MKTRIIIAVILFGMDIFSFRLNAQDPSEYPIIEIRIDPTDSIPSLRSTTTGNETPDYMPRIIPNSPNAASLGLYGSMPVGHYTGTPDISIPLYELELDGKKFPITLSYHASGIKVAQEASWVGMGWALGAGGCISREMRGGDDFGSSSQFGYYSSNDFPYTENDLTSYIKQRIYNGDVDFEPDLFHFNFGSHSGTMFFKKDDNYTDYLKPKAFIKYIKEHIEAVYDINKSMWIITDGDGYRYYFGGSENSRDITTVYTDVRSNATGSSFIPINEATEDPHFNTSNPRIYITAWYIDSIVSPFNNKIEFKYKKDIIGTPYSMENDISIVTSPINEFINTCFDPVVANAIKDRHDQYAYSSSKIEQALLDSIVFQSGAIIFRTSSDRKDLHPPYDEEKAQKLSRMDVNNKQGPVKSVVFNYFYAGNQNNYKTCRLFLSDIAEISGNDTASSYSFEYNHPGLLPPKYSKNIDYWGYYNNKSNNKNWGYPGFGYDLAAADEGTLIPSLLVYKRGTFGTSEYSLTFSENNYCYPAPIPGADRSPDENVMQYGMLTSIQYPTGGKTTFLYEPHTFDSFMGGIEKTKIISIDQAGFDAPNGGMVSFVLGKDTDVNITRTVEANQTFGDSEVQAGYILEINSQDPLGYFTKCEGNYLCNGYYSFPKLNSGETKKSGNHYLRLKKGSYRMYIVFNPNHTTINPHWFSLELESIQEGVISSGGGLRVREIRDVDFQNSLHVRKFNYSNGVLMTPPFKFFNYWLHYGSSGFCDHEKTASYLLGTTRSAGTLLYPYSSSTDPTVGYGKVEEVFGDNNGKTIYNFSNANIAEITYDITQNGRPLSTRFLDNIGNPKKEISYHYERVDGITDAAAGFSYLFLQFHYSPSGDPALPYKTFYDIRSRWWKLTKETTTEYDNGSALLTTIKEYPAYNSNNFLPETVKMTDSRGRVREQRMKFPYDYPGYSGNGGMVSKHLVNTPIETISLVGGNVTSALKTDYKDTLNTWLPKTIYTLNSDVPCSPGSYGTYYKPKVFFDRYTSAKKNRQIRGIDNVPIVYLWGYNSQYPVAEIKNADYDQVKNQIQGGQTTIDAIASSDTFSISDQGKINALRTALPGAMITTYTYKPLVGVLSVTDPSGKTVYYEYDIFGRLKHAKDLNNKILESYDYHYRNQ